MSKVKKSYIDELNSHPNKIEIEFAGETRPFLLCGYGAKLARARNQDPVPSIGVLLGKIAPAIGDVQKARVAKDLSWVKALGSHIDGELLDALCVIIWWGLLPYDNDLELEWVEIYSTPTSIWAVFESVFASAMMFNDGESTDEKKSADTKKEKAEGN